MPEEHVIRLITRLLFVWFIKEKGLIAPDLFIEEQVGSLLRDYDRGNGDSYYRAVMQNLFFATLNSEIGERGFSKESNTTHRNFSRYRYKAEIADPDRLLDLFALTPFINGGLFDCLDSFESTAKVATALTALPTICSIPSAMSSGSCQFPIVSSLTTKV